MYTCSIFHTDHSGSDPAPLWTIRASPLAISLLVSFVVCGREPSTRTATSRRGGERFVWRLSHPENARPELPPNQYTAPRVWGSSGKIEGVSHRKNLSFSTNKKYPLPYWSAPGCNGFGEVKTNVGM